MKRVMIILLFSYGIWAQNIFNNGDFESDAEGWQVYNESTSSAESSMSRESGDSPSGEYHLQVDVTSTGTENWHCQLQAPQDWSAENGATYNLSFSAKGPEDIHVGIGYGPEDNYDYKEGNTFDIKSDWDEFVMSFTSDKSGVDAIRVNFYLGDATGVYSFDNVILEKSSAQQVNFYEDADSRIEDIRKNTMTLSIEDADGEPVPGADIRVELREPAFKWGTALNFGTAGTADETWYRETAAEYFQCGVFENDFKWPSYEPSQDYTNNDVIEEYLNWADSLGNGFHIRGHALEWGIEKYDYDQFWARQQDSAFYAQALKTRITRDMQEYAGRIPEYDVWNEVCHEPAIFDDFGYSLFDSAHVWARNTDPDAKLYVNEYSVVSGGYTETYYNFIDEKLKNDVPIDGIGVQSHFWSGIVDPDNALKKLDRLAEFGLPIKITEFDLNVEESGITEQQQADNMAKFMRAAFSHPAVDGFLFWGFWDQKHWIDGGGIFNNDKSPKIAADSVYNLIHNTWSTNADLTSDAQGQASLSAFYGKYDITVYFGEDSVEYDIELPKDSSVTATLTQDGTVDTEISGIIRGTSMKKNKGFTVKKYSVSKNRIISSIHSPVTGECEIRLYNAQGKLIADKVLSLKKGLNSVDITYEGSGVFFAVISNKNKVVTGFKGMKMM